MQLYIRKQEFKYFRDKGVDKLLYENLTHPGRTNIWTDDDMRNLVLDWNLCFPK